MKPSDEISLFIEGPIQSSVLENMIKKHQSKTNIGAHDIFLGQVRADLIDERAVKAIEYTAYDKMAREIFIRIKEETFSQFSISCLHCKHSLGIVEAGEISFCVFVSAPHRQAAFDACRRLVQRIKIEVPIWGREIFEDQCYQWKVNRDDRSNTQNNDSTQGNCKSYSQSESRRDNDCHQNKNSS